jgi:flagellar L-ring protein FlgH
MNLAKAVIFFLLGLSLAGCSSTIEKLKRVGKAPDFAKLEVPIDEEQISPAEKEQMNRQHVRRTNSL